MAQGISEDRLVHYFAGECSAEEEAEIEAWMQGDPARRQRVRELGKLWEAAGRPPARRNANAPDANAMWEQLSRRMNLPKSKALPGTTPGASSRGKMPSRRHPGERIARRPRRGRCGGWRQPVRTAAAMIFVALAAFLIAEVVGVVDGGGASEAAMREVATEAGERVRVTLGDGTQVMLNAQSTLRLPAQFAGNERVVELQGEAYFEVTPDEDRPFVVRAEETVTRVLGTQFNVGAYPGDGEVQVVVAEGQVAVRPKGRERGQELLLNRRQMGRLSKTGSSALRREVDPSRYLAWTEGRLVFRDAPFPEVARKLERWYNLEVNLEGASSEEVDRLNASFKEEPLAEVLGVIAESLELDCEREGKVVTFSPAEIK